MDKKSLYIEQVTNQILNHMLECGVIRQFEPKESVTHSNGSITLMQKYHESDQVQKIYDSLKSQGYECELLTDQEFNQTYHALRTLPGQLKRSPSDAHLFD